MKTYKVKFYGLSGLTADYCSGWFLTTTSVNSLRSDIEDELAENGNWPLQDYNNTLTVFHVSHH